MTTKGYIHIYTGNGKGKTTAALGLALRAAGAGKTIFFAQFVKGRPYSEITAINNLIPNITIKQFGRRCFIKNIPDKKDIESAREGLAVIKKIIASDKYDVIILDEATIAIHYNLFSINELTDVIKDKNRATELIITGRYAPSELIEMADLVTEMKEIKHYYNKGIMARKGIEY